MTTSANSLLINLKTFFVFLLASALFSLSSCGNSDDKASLLKCDTPWEQRSETQKLIGTWCDGSYQPGSGRTIVSKTMKFQSMLCFYSDGTIKAFQLSHSYVDQKSEMDNGTNVKVENGRLTYISSKYGEKSYPIKIRRDELVIEGYISIGNGAFRKCE